MSTSSLVVEALVKQLFLYLLAFVVLIHSKLVSEGGKGKNFLRKKVAYRQNTEKRSKKGFLI